MFADFSYFKLKEPQLLNVLLDTLLQLQDNHDVCMILSVSSGACHLDLYDDLRIIFFKFFE